LMRARETPKGPVQAGLAWRGLSKQELVFGFTSLHPGDWNFRRSLAPGSSSAEISQQMSSLLPTAAKSDFLV